MNDRLETKDDSFLAEIIITLVPCSSPAEQFISVTAIFSGKMEVTKVAFLLLFLGVVNAEVCERKGEEIHTCTQCLWMYEDLIQDNKCITSLSMTVYYSTINRRDTLLHWIYTRNNRNYIVVWVFVRVWQFWTKF